MLPMGGYISQQTVEAQGPCCLFSWSNAVICFRDCLMFQLLEVPTFPVDYRRDVEFYVPKLSYVVKWPSSGQRASPCSVCCKISSCFYDLGASIVLYASHFCIMAA